MPDHPFGEETFPNLTAVCLDDPSLAFQGHAVEAPPSSAKSLWLPSAFFLSSLSLAMTCAGSAQLGTGEGLFRGNWTDLSIK